MFICIRYRKENRFPNHLSFLLSGHMHSPEYANYMQRKLHTIIIYLSAAPI